MQLVVQTYKKGIPNGLGDFLRSSFANFVYCYHSGDYKYDMYFKDGIFEKTFESIELLDRPFRHISTCDFKAMLKSNEEIYKEDEIMAYKTFLEKRMSERLKERIHRLSPKTSFDAIHIRTGDHFTPIYKPDIRCKEDIAIGILETFLKNKKLNNPVLFTDSSILKDIVMQREMPIKIIFSIPLHTAYNNCKEVDKIDVIDSVAEFFIMGRADRIFTFSSTDGYERLSSYSLMSSFIYDKPIYNVNKSCQVKAIDKQKAIFYVT